MCSHYDAFMCQLCGKCYACRHKQTYDGTFYWWRCPTSGTLSRTEMQLRGGMIIHEKKV